MTCSRCDYTTYVEKEALGHAEVSHEAKAPTCTEIGWDAYVTCSRCDYSTYVEKEALGHDEVTHEAQAPTCTEIGWDAYVTCSRCDYTTYVEKNALGHDEVSHEAKAPTCTEIGWDAYVTCSRCDHTTYVEKAAIGHDWSTTLTEGEITHWYACENGCTQKDRETAHVYEWEYDGNEHWKECACGAEQAGSREEHGGWNADTNKCECGYGCQHTSKSGENPVAATCETEGQFLHFICNSCGKHVNEAGTVLTDDQWKIPALGHEWGEVEYSWNDDYTSCTVSQKCSRGCTRTETDEYIDFETTPATCGADGYTVYTAVFTKDWITEKTQTTTVVDVNSATGEHSYAYEQVGTAQHKQVCSVCDAELDAEDCIDVTGDNTHACHYCERPNVGSCDPKKYNSTWQDGNGKHWHECPECHAHYDEADHVFVNLKSDESGHWYACECNVFETKFDHTDKTIKDHKCDICDWVVSKCVFDHEVVAEQYFKSAADCENAAVYYKSCVCGEKGTDKDTFVHGKALGHDWHETDYEVSEQDKTCTAKRVCKRDESHVETEDVEITSEVTIPATCSTQGWRKYTANFEADWAKVEPVELQDVAIDSNAHAWGEATYSFAEDGKSCTATRVCGHNASHVETANATITSAVKSAATCEAKGWTTYTATFAEAWAAKQTKDVQDIPVTNHAWGEATYSFAVDGKSCTATRTCANDASHVETANATITSAVKTPATCEGMGTTTYTATFAEAWAAEQTLDVEDIAANGHDGTLVNGQSAACGVGGWKDYYACENCEKIFSDEACKNEIVDLGAWKSEEGKIEALSHIPGAPVVENSIEATCGQVGTYDEVVYCTVCKEELSRETKKGEVVPHSPADAVQENVIEATCTTPGSYDSVVKCSVCGKELSRETVTVEAPGHTRPAYGVMENRVDNTCTTPGSYDTVMYCTVCHEELSRTTTVIPVRGHNIVIDKGFAATCTTYGKTEGKHCTVCNEILVAQEIIVATGHSYDGDSDAYCNTCGYKRSLVCKHIDKVERYDQNYKWIECANCGEIFDKQERAYTIVFQGFAGGQDISLPGEYPYDANTVITVPKMYSRYFEFSGNWYVGSTVLPPETSWVMSTFASLIKDGSDVIYVPGTYMINALKPNAVLMSMSYSTDDDNTNGDDPVFMTIALFANIEEGMLPHLNWAGTQDSIEGTLMGNSKTIYYYKIPLTISELTTLDKEMTLSISYEGSTFSQNFTISVAGYIQALTDMFKDEENGELKTEDARKLMEASRNYAEAYMAHKNFNADDCKVTSAPTFDIDANNLNAIFDGDATMVNGDPVIASNQIQTNVELFATTYTLLYRFAINLPANTTLKSASVILTDTAEEVVRTQEWDGQTGKAYGYSSKETDDGIEYYVVEIDGGSAKDMAVRYATVYVEYEDADGNVHFAYSQTVKYGITTYLNRQLHNYMAKIADYQDVNAENQQIWLKHSMYNNLRTLASFADPIVPESSETSQIPSSGELTD